MEYCSICKYEATVAYEFSNHLSPRFVHILFGILTCDEERNLQKFPQQGTRTTYVKLDFALVMQLI